VLRGSHAAQSQFPADLYLEGSDQHRGWFHSSLLTSSMLNGAPPYKALLTHGFVVDGEGKKMSKSLGNTVAPQKMSDTLGADILRLWVASTDYTGELSISDEILKRVTEAYRRIRNTLRFLLANTSDFDPPRTPCRLPSCWKSTATRSPTWPRCRRTSPQHYERYEFHPVVQAAELLLGRPGRLLPRHPEGPPVHHRRRSHARRSAQTALWHITQSLLRVMAPALSFTAEEAWASSPARKPTKASDETIFTQTWWACRKWPTAPHCWTSTRRCARCVPTSPSNWKNLRTSGAIGSSLQAELTIKAAGDKYKLLASLDDDLKFVFITSQATAVEVGGEAEEAVAVTPSSARRSASAAGTTAPMSAPCRPSGPVRPLRTATCSASGEKRKFA
jgi:isoleucyl-tRNA synthetase